MSNIEIINNEVLKLLINDKTGHNMNHINRVIELSKKIANKENVNLDIVISIALLHDVDDYKIFGEENSINLINANNILNKTTFNKDEKDLIINSIKTIGYSKRLEGIIPKNIEAMIVSDADMLDALGVNGILRTFEYDIKHNNDFFNPNIFPNLNINSKEYKSIKNNSSINHIFEKLLKLKDLMLTETGKKEAKKRHDFIIDFLKEYFYEENNKEWIKYLEEYISK